MFGILGEAVSLDCHDLTALVADLDTQELADLIAEHDRALTRLADFKLVLAAAWADHHGHGGSTGSMLMERAMPVGGDGTPKVSEGGIDEYGDLASISNWSARRLLADVLDLRHRLPRLWSRVTTGGVLDWQVRKIAQATRILGAEAAGQVDRKLEPWVGQLPWGRLQTLLDAEILAADPELAARLAKEAEGATGVWAGRTDYRNIRSVFVRTDPLSAAWFMGMVNRIADLLAADGDSRTADQRRAAAVGILARPADALALLHRHAGGQTETDDLLDGPSTRSGHEQQSGGEVLFPERAEGPTSDAYEPDAEPGPDVDEACVAEYLPFGHPREHPDRLPPEEPKHDDNPDPPLRLNLNLPAAFDPGAAQPTVNLHFHLSDTGLRLAGGHALIRGDRTDPATLSDLVSWLAGTGCKVVIRPVIDPASTAPADAYEIPDRIRNAVRYRDIADASPWGTSTSAGLDLDHTIPWNPNGPTGQTRLGNLAPLTRATHRAKTVGAKRMRQPEPGVYLCRSRHGHLTLVTNRGSINLGQNAFSRAVWSLAGPACDTIAG